MKQLKVGIGEIDQEGITFLCGHNHDSIIYLENLLFIYSRRKNSLLSVIA